MTRPADLSRLKTFPLAQRASKVRRDSFGGRPDPDASVAAFLEGLPDILGARQLRGLAGAVADAHLGGRPVLWASGGHIVKTGVSPVLIDLMERGIVTGLVLNGAAAIHDWEIAAIGATSEDVAEGLPDGRFGMARETAEAINGAATVAARDGRGFGEVLGEQIEAAGLPHRDASLLAACHRLGVPATLHVALGCDVVHPHPSADGAAIGAATLHDFRRLVTLVGGLSGGVWVNCGSAVLLPEVFLKALSAARNLSGGDRRVADFCTADLDMQRHYRTEENVLRRPLEGGTGRAYRVLGHHELNIPLLAVAILAAIADRRSNSLT